MKDFNHFSEKEYSDADDFDLSDIREAVEEAARFAAEEDALNKVIKLIEDNPESSPVNLPFYFGTVKEHQLRDRQDQEKIDATCKEYEEKLRSDAELNAKRMKFIVEKAKKKAIARQASLLAKQSCARDAFVKKEIKSAENLEEVNRVKHPHLFLSDNRHYYDETQSAITFFQPGRPRTDKQPGHVMKKGFKR